MTSFSSDRIAEIHSQLHIHLPSEPALRVKALESVLVEKGLLDSRTIDAWVRAYPATPHGQLVKLGNE